MMRSVPPIALALAAFLLISHNAFGTPSLIVSLEAGPAFSRVKWFGPVPIRLAPQIAIWISDADGAFVATVYASAKAGRGSWFGSGGDPRSEALPIWSHAHDGAAVLPEAAEAAPDSISGPTPKGSVSKAWIPPHGLPPGNYMVRVELNLAHDWNEAYPDGLPRSDPRWTAVNGQPSILWEGSLALGGAPASVLLTRVGTGALRGESGAASPGLEGITSARDIASSIKAEFIP